jgi:hypothetical protein
MRIASDNTIKKKRKNKNKIKKKTKYICVCVCVYVHTYVHTHTQTHIDIYIYIYLARVADGIPVCSFHQDRATRRRQRVNVSHLLRMRISKASVKHEKSMSKASKARQGDSQKAACERLPPPKHAYQ